MRYLVIPLAIASLLAVLSGSAFAQTPENNAPAAAPFDLQEVSGTVSLTPEMWFYLHEQRRTEDPQRVVRENAQRKAQARRNRIAAMKWFGFSASRPTANPTPYTSVYSPTWAGNGAHPYVWRGAGSPVIAVQVNGTTVTR